MNTHLKKIDIRLEYAVLSNANKTRFIAVAPHINIVGFGKSEDEAVKDFDKAVKCFIHFHEKNKNLHAKLLTLGWKVADNYETIAPKQFSVPTELLANATIQKSASKHYAAAHC